eukprot:TRINITY_DN47013_c0_g1_i1.p1 TRINITY_DN47013_c0_g1~~TRINITY_DN47013_c0_g1_i1.p1  ORF type:complete len:266 (+),score=61.17 TRINITY_DN47013_c0_g1_i1:86-799(+)
MAANSEEVVASTPLSSPAPYLDEYFRVQEELTLHMEELGNPVKLGRDPAKLKEFRAEMLRQRERLREISGKSFDHHDTNKNGVLEVAEGQALFEHFVDRLVPFTISAACKSLDKVIAPQINLYKQILADDPAEWEKVQEKIMTQIKELQEQMVTTYQGRGEAYASDKLAKNAAAFAVLDTKGDGKLTKEDVVEALSPDTDKHYEFLMALGMLTAEEVDQQKQGRAAKEVLDHIESQQ